ncbi:hypothetical protein SAMN04487936_101520 [Halobacillus dabanensis]|uniref:Uncharacterized protein n=1 Tax=Halobacillus dabanensis TaxID=240302 RepID=A0A1I3Q2W6_HALDA|nr:hypothetical protein [Halobacillus dabanensis]SFJ28233.1 hypothetical protein SAMN04487936_101520 [Halobacillus dabanensis]
MIMMDENEKDTYEDLMNSFKNAESIEEIRYYFFEIQLYLDNLPSTNGLSIPTSQLEEYQRLRKGLLDSTSVREVSYYEGQIHEWLNKIHPLS